MKIKKILTESAKKAYIDQSGSLASVKNKIESIAKEDGCTDFYYFDSVKFAEPLSAAKAGENIVVYTDDDCNTNCPELSEFKNVKICNIIDKVRTEALTEADDTSDENEEDIIVDDVLSASVSEIADAVQTAAEVASGGEETYSDEKAQKIATELKTAAKGFDAAAWAPLDVRSEFTDILDDCLANAMIAKAGGTTDGVDLLVTGLPGSGKTGVFKKWADDRGVKYFYLNAKNDDLGAILNGFPVDTVDKDEDGKEVHQVSRSYSKSLDLLDREKSVLFLDEFNRAPEKLRAVLLSLINEHVVDGPGEDGYRHFNNLLFSVACINPAVATDPGATDLNDAERSRFVNKLKWDSKPEEAVKYINFYLNKLIKQLDPKNENYAFFYVRYKKILSLASALLTDPRFEFNTRADLNDLFYNTDAHGNPDPATMLNQRSITDGLMSHGFSKKKFLNWIDHNSDFLEKDKKMIHDILDSWVEPDVTAPNNNSNSANNNASIESENTEVDDQAAATDEGDFNSIFGDDGEETDSDLFGSTASKAGTAAKVSAADALARIKGFDFSL